jgi:putative nucleotidyltransferase with HDIG domain
VATVFVHGLAALVDALFTLNATAVPWRWLGLAALTLASGVFTIKVPALNAALSISETFLFITVLMFGGAPAVITVALDGLTISLIRRRRDFRHAAFNLAEPTLSMWVASKAYYALAGVGPLYMEPASIAQLGIPALALSAIYFVMNSGLNSLAMASERRISPLPLLRKFFLGVSLNYFGGASIAILLAVNMQNGDVIEVAASLLAIAPLIIVSYFTFRSSMGRLEDENRHLAEVNRLNLKLVESLAMAAEARDRATSRGHIRRVQKYALRLAHSMGITDARELEAIRAAGLLHDMGKIRIPDHILNKPGKLTDAEYDVMKTHAPLGADMVSDVDFPYPVAPIVRHHHENWDGTGYPARLNGTAIPIGARILSVADCYDALRSHRPYRRGYSHEDAMRMVFERSGAMYDPTVVRALETVQDEFRSELYEDLLPEEPDAVASVASEVGSADEATRPLPIELRLSDTAVLLRLNEDLSRLGPGAGVETACDTVSRHLQRLAPAGLVVFYKRNESADEVVAAYASGFCEALVRDVHMPLGHGVSGWVAANTRSVVNADAALDLGQRLEGIEPRFRSILSVPLTHLGHTCGVLTLYASQPQAFREEQRQALELVSTAIAEVFERALEYDASRLDLFPAQELLGVASRRSLDELLATDRRRSADSGRSRAVLCLKNDGDHGVMLHATMAVSQSTRIADLIFRPTQDSLVVLMKDADAAAERLILQRIAAALPADIVPPPFEASPLRLGFACGPRDGDYWSDLLYIAQHRAWRGPVAVTPAAAAVAAHGDRGLPWKA